MKKYNKLVRSKIVPNLEARGIKVVWHKAAPLEYRRALLAKLVEEAKELFEAGTPEEQVDEFGDVLDVVDAIKKLFPNEWEDILTKKSMKRLEKGGFEDGIILDETE